MYIIIRVTPVLQWFQLNFGAGNVRGRRLGTSALRMLLRLAAVKSGSQSVVTPHSLLTRPLSARPARPTLH